MTPEQERAIREQFSSAQAEALLAILHDEPGPVRDRLLSIPEAAVALGLSRSALYNLIGSGRVRVVRLGRRVVIPSSVIAEVAEGR